MAATQSVSELQRTYYEGAVSQLPLDTEQVGASATAIAAAVNTATLPAVAAKKNYLLGFTISTGNATAAVTGVVTVTGLAIGTMNFQIVEPAAVGGLLSITFPVALAASAVNTAIVVTLPAITGGAVSTVAAFGYVR